MTSLIEARGVSRAFPGVLALDDVSFTVQPGESVGLVGENGSGKSTLLKILAGRLPPSRGKLFVDGDATELRTPTDALRRGIALVAQEIQVQDDLSIAENLFGREMPKRAGFIDWSRASSDARGILQRAGLGHISPTTRAGSLALHDQQMISILKVVERKPRLVLFDEPTSSLTSEEVARLYTLIEGLRQAGAAVVYITHRLHEYFDLTDRLVVLRDGRIVADQRTADVDEAQLVRQMVGRDVARLFERPKGKDDARPNVPPVLEVSGLRTRSLKGIDLQVRPGEIVGVAGQAGSGRTSLACTLFGRWGYQGTIAVDGKTVALRSPKHAIDAGIALVPEDRRREGLVGLLSVAENLTIPSWSTKGRRYARIPRKDRAAARQLGREFGVRAANVDVLASSLSGGNQQKIVIAKWAPRDVKVLILDEPTRGVDVGAKAEIYKLIEQQAAAGVAVIVMSSELLEVLRLADRVVVMSAGAIVGEIAGKDATEERITEMAFTSPVEEGPENS